MHQSSTGEIFYIDDDISFAGDATLSNVDVNIHDGLPSAREIPKWHSHANATQKIFLDFDGHTVSGTGWNEFHQGQSIHAPAFDLDGDQSSFSTAEISIAEKVWLRVSEDFAPFEIDVTTEAPAPRSFHEGSQAIRVLITSNIDSASGNTWMHTGHGVAYLNSWRTENDTPVWVFANRLGANDKSIAESVSHELGHAFGLHHDGAHQPQQEEQEYFSGHGDHQDGWAPIMGLGYHREVTQWDRGEYKFSNNDENDLEMIASNANGIRRREDDFPDHIIFASRLNLDSSGRVAQGGIISTRTDRDAFRLELPRGRLDLHVSTASLGANLKLGVSLYDGNGRIIDTRLSYGLDSVHFLEQVEGGIYFVVVDGVGYGDPATNGYSDYGSLGQYIVSAEIEPEASPLDQIRLAAKRRLP